MWIRYLYIVIFIYLFIRYGYWILITIKFGEFRKKIIVPLHLKLYQTITVVLA